MKTRIVDGVTYIRQPPPTTPSPEVAEQWDGGLAGGGVRKNIRGGWARAGAPHRDGAFATFAEAARDAQAMRRNRYLAAKEIVDAYEAAAAKFRTV